MHLTPFCPLFSGCFVLPLCSFLLPVFTSHAIWWLSLVLYLDSFLISFCVFAIGFCFVFTMRLTYNNLQVSHVAQLVKNLPAVQETWVRSLGWEDPLEKEMETHSSILVWKISWQEEPGGLQSMGSKRVGHNWATNSNLLTYLLTYRELDPVCCNKDLAQPN